MTHDNFFNTYFKYVGHNEAPTIYHRWAALSAIGAMICREVYLPFGHKNIYPNQYILLTGGPGARKGTAIDYAMDMLRTVDYAYFSPDRNAKEAMWRFMADQTSTSIATDLNELVFDTGCAQLYIAIDEFLDYTGVGNDELITNLANLWKNLPSYDNPKERSADVKIIKPTVNILGGITPGGIAKSFGSLAEEGGFFSRTLFIYYGDTNDKITWPTPTNEDALEELTSHIETIKLMSGPIQLTEEARTILDKIYRTAPNIPDKRFSYYSTRRFIHLLKLCIILTVMQHSYECTAEIAIYANTILYLAEQQMPHALGEYGKARHSEVANSIIDIVKRKDRAVSMIELWKQVRRDLDKQSSLLDILGGLVEADRLQRVDMPNKTGIGYLPVIHTESKWQKGLIDYSMMRPEEIPDA